MRKSPQLSLIGMAISIKTLTLHLKVSCIQMDQAQMKAQKKTLKFLSTTKTHCSLFTCTTLYSQDKTEILAQ